MYEVSVREHFDAAHYLRGYQGKCEGIHGHRFLVVAIVRAHEVDDIGLAYDFVALRRHLKEILARLDHVYLNDLPPFDRVNPSSENIASTIYEELSARLSTTRVTLSKVEVWESPESCVAYMP